MGRFSGRSVFELPQRSKNYAGCRQEFESLPLRPLQQCRVFRDWRGTIRTSTNLNPPANSSYSIEAAERYDVMNPILRRTIVGRQFFEISTLVPAREFNQQYE